MQFYLNDDKKTLEIWLTNEEKSNAALLSSLNPVYDLFSAKKYTVAVFRSGTHSLYDNTRDLLKNNRMISFEV